MQEVMQKEERQQTKERQGRGESYITSNRRRKQGDVESKENRAGNVDP